MMKMMMVMILVTIYKDSDTYSVDAENNSKKILTKS